MSCAMSNTSSESDEVSIQSDQNGDDVIVSNESDADWLSKLTYTCSKLKNVEDIGEVYAIVQQKERDLQLAAEFGHVLVQENEQLKQTNKQLTENFSVSFEELKEEKYRLKLQFDALTEEYRLAKAEHLADIESLKQQLCDEQKNAQSREQANRQLINELTQQNELLSEQLLQESRVEENARAQISSLRLSVSSNPDVDALHAEQLEAIKNEMAETKAEMDLRLQLKKNECDQLASELESAHDVMSTFEKNAAADAEKIRNLESEVQRQEDINMQLLLKLENLSMSSSSMTSVMSPVTLTEETSLFAELELLSQTMSLNSFDNRPTGKITIGTQLKQEILEVFRQLQRLTLEVQGRANEWSPEVVEISDLHAGQLLTTLTDLRTLVHSRLQSTITAPTTSSERSQKVDSLQKQLNSVQGQLNASQSRANSLENELAQRDRQLLRKCDELKSVELQFQSQRVELLRLRQERDRLLDKAVGLHTPDSVLQQARDERDEALRLNSELVGEVAKLRLDLATLDRQLLDAVSQKLQLSQQLEAWQSDMQELIDNKMADEIARDQLKYSSSNTSTPSTLRPSASSVASPSSRKRFSFMWS